MNAATLWTSVDLTGPQARDKAIDHAQRVMSASGETHLRHDLDWALGGEAGGSPSIAFSAEGDNGVLGSAVLLRQGRPRPFQIGGLTSFREGLTHYDLWSAPLIAGVPEASEAWTTHALAFLDAVRRRMAFSSEAIGFEGVRAGGPFHRLLHREAGVEGGFLQVGPGDRVMHRQIVLPPTLDAYMAGLGQPLRASLDNSRRRLLRDFADDVEVTCYETAEDVEHFLDHAVAVTKISRHGRLQELGRRDRQAIETRLGFAARKGWLRSYVLFCSGRPAAFMLGCQHEGCFHCTDIGIDPDCAKWTADSILQIEVLADLYNRDNRPDVFDFSTGSGDHEARFGNREQEEVNLLLLPRTLRHAILAGAYRRLDGMADIARFAADRTGVGRGLKKSVRRLAGAGSESSPS